MEKPKLEITGTTFLQIDKDDLFAHRLILEYCSINRFYIMSVTILQYPYFCIKLFTFNNEPVTIIGHKKLLAYILSNTDTTQYTNE